MTEFNQARIRVLNTKPVNRGGKYVLYWMQIFRRFEYNFALQHAVEQANTLNKPLLIYEGLSVSYPWANDRFHTFLIEGMSENFKTAQNERLNYLPYIESVRGEGNGLVELMASHASLVVTDDYPVFIINKHNSSLANKVAVPYHVVDSNGLIPMQVSKKAPYSAFIFRKIVQKHFVEAITNMPEQKPLSSLKYRERINLSFIPEHWRRGLSDTDRIDTLIRSFKIDHTVTPLRHLKGTRKAALERYSQFCSNKLAHYELKRNDPDYQSTSGMSGWLHFGKISEHEMVLEVLSNQPAGWDLSYVTNNNGSKENFFNGDKNITSYLDELVTWRGVGFHFAHFTTNYDSYKSLPAWALKTLDHHRDDHRTFIYELKEFESARTHDPIWNAAQNQLLQEGIIHNYLRMLWGKKILEWSKSPESALEIMIELNNKYAIDGRDPNSYSGIFWILGRFDRAWFERPIFGKIRYMSSESARKKIKMNHYLKRYGNNEKNLNS